MEEDKKAYRARDAQAGRKRAKRKRKIASASLAKTFNRSYLPSYSKKKKKQKRG